MTQKNLHKLDPNGFPVLRSGPDDSIETIPATAGTALDDLTWAYNCLSNARVKLEREHIERAFSLAVSIDSIIESIKTVKNRWPQ